MDFAKKKVFAGVLFLAVLSSGCSTVKGAAAGTAGGVACGVGYTAMGVAEDAKGTRNAVVWMDNWVKRNLW
ncbi:MAG: hypothetical protein PHG40_00510 [Candidatus Omnitrophica bacterium]|nr:hypothetical protein [Candidatus Omnitrophota bacterium]